MNRREMIAACSSALATAGVSARTEAIEADPAPLILTVTVPEPLSEESYENIRQSMKGCMEMIAARVGHWVPVVVLHGGATLEAVRDPRITINEAG